MKDLPEDLRDLVTRHQDRGASFWLEALPLEESDFILSKEVFKDGVRLRFDLPLPDLPSSCVCGDKFTVEHALSCNKGVSLTNVMTILETYLSACLNVYALTLNRNHIW